MHRDFLRVFKSVIGVASNTSIEIFFFSRKKRKKKKGRKLILMSLLFATSKEAIHTRVQISLLVNGYCPAAY